MGEMEVVNAVKQFGFFAILVALFIWRDWVREQRMAKRLDEQGDKFNTALSTVVTDNARAMERMAQGIEKQSDRLEKLEQTLSRIGDRISDWNVMKGGG